ncbi:MAG: cytochrome c3 family protein [Planctomycetia bacterium]|nr:cytochrome c3 family protein [Planctomycetia bacterium]
MPSAVIFRLVALLLGMTGVWSVRNSGGTARRRSWLPLAVASICCAILASFAIAAVGEGEAPAEPFHDSSGSAAAPPSRSEKQADAKPSGANSADKPAPRKLTAPKNWPPGHPLPNVASNCVACHLTAGRELTAAVEHFVRSVHDLNGLTCYDCHGGNRDDDARAHEEDFDFIGTKLSAHLKTCSECHDGEAERLAAGPHHWDFSKRINTQYPTCVDCHGNHDIGNPPAEFKLTDMCLDCHHKLDKDYPRIASVVKHGDQLAAVLRDVQKRNIALDDPVPEAFREPLAKLRTDTMNVMHGAKEIPAEKARDLNDRADKIRTGLANWLKSTN